MFQMTNSQEKIKIIFIINIRKYVLYSIESSGAIFQKLDFTLGSLGIRFGRQEDNANEIDNRFILTLLFFIK